jgi:hypothetical protein
MISGSEEEVKNMKTLFFQLFWKLRKVAALEVWMHNYRPWIG